MNFGELKTEFYARGTDYLSEDAAGVARASRWINQAYAEILSAQPWPFLVATATGLASAGTVIVPRLRKIRAVTDVDGTDGTVPGHPLGRVSMEDLVRDGEDLSSTGTPVSYYIDPSDGTTTIRAFPIGGTIRVDYFTRVEILVGDEDEPLFDEQYHDLIIDRAMIKAYKDSDNFEGAAALREEYNAGLVAMAEDYLVPSRDVQYIDVNSYDG